MPVTKSQVEEILMSYEPDYGKAAALLGPDALPHLIDFINGRDEGLASKAVYMVGFIKDAKVGEILMSAAASQNDLVRIAAAYSAKHLEPAAASKLLSKLVQDVEYGVRKMVLVSAPKNSSNELIEKIKLMERSDSMHQLRDRASAVLKKIQKPTQ